MKSREVYGHVVFELPDLVVIEQSLVVRASRSVDQECRSQEWVGRRLAPSGQ